jgi:hypothetical protein
MVLLISTWVGQDDRFWPVSSHAAEQQHTCFWDNSRHATDTVESTQLTRSRSGVPLNTYSTASSAMASMQKCSN